MTRKNVTTRHGEWCLDKAGDEEDARVTCRQLQLSVKGIIMHYRCRILFNVHCTGFHSYANSPFGKPRRTVYFSAVRCVGNESKIIDCPKTTMNYTYEQGKLLAGHLAVAGVTCKQHNCECSFVTDNSQLTAVTIILLTGLTAIFGTATVTLAAW